MVKVEFFFDLSSPWTYLAFHNIQPIVQDAGAHIIWRPVLVGGIFNAVNQSVYAAREDASNPKFRHSGKILRNWADWTGVPLFFPSKHHPLKSVHAMRMCCALEEDQDALFPFIEAAFQAYFVREDNLDDPETLIAVADQAGFDGAALFEKANTEGNKLRLRSNTEEVIHRGGYGSPTIFVNHEDMYFGNDQLPLVKRAIKLARS